MCFTCILPSYSWFEVEELKTTPNESAQTSAPALVAQALDQELNAGPSDPGQKVVNDLTSMVVKKKKKTPCTDGDGTATKRKADSDGESTSTEKKPRTEAPKS